MTQCIRLLSDPCGHLPLHQTPPEPHLLQHHHSDRSTPTPLPHHDPFSDSDLLATYTTNGTDRFPAPAFYPRHRHSWLHLFPEGMIHQHPERAMRYFKWGVARLVLEAEPCPDLVPVWIDGMQEVMSERRGWPRFVPRAGNTVRVCFGELVDGEARFGEFRARWRALRRRVEEEGEEEAEDGVPGTEALGVVREATLRFGDEAERLRVEVTLAVRDEVLKLRRAQGLPDEDPKRSLAETFWREGSGRKKREGVMEDDSIVKDM